jgi:hypothetical protein
MLFIFLCVEIYFTSIRLRESRSKLHFAIAPQIIIRQALGFDETKTRTTPIKKIGELQKIHCSPGALICSFTPLVSAPQALTQF